MSPISVGAAIAGVSTLNVLQIAVIGWGSIPVNMVTYYLRHVDGPPSRPFERSTGAAFWRPFMELPLPWQYFAATGLLYLAIVVVVCTHAPLRFTPTRKGWEFWRTTPRYLAILGLAFALAMWTAMRYYTPLDTVADPYLVGVAAALIGSVIAWIAFLLSPRDKRRARPSSKRTRRA